MIIIDTVLLWLLRSIAAAAIIGAICMTAFVLISDKKIREEEALRREQLERFKNYREVPIEWKTILDGDDTDGGMKT